MQSVSERFLRYVKVDTESKEDVETVPSTSKQFVLAGMLTEEMTAIGFSDVRMSDNCYVYGTIPANVDDDRAALGFIAHMDTSCAMSGKDVKPQVIHNYEGGVITLNKELGLVLDPMQFPDLKKRIGKDIITTDGTTLLGADDKAGIAEIMTMAEYLLTHPEIKHGKICIGFTPDEEVGRGADYFDVEGFGADFAYTVDGGALGEIEYENFNAASMEVTVTGNSVHPGSAKNVMKNASTIAMKFNSLLPVGQVPELTEGYEGFFHLTKMNGECEEAHLSYILRDHDRDKLEAMKKLAFDAEKYMNALYGEGTVKINIKDSYSNMKFVIEPYMFLVDNVKKVMADLDIPAKVCAIRGGTDGARLSFMGLPCPNLCTGGANYHGKYEYCDIQSMEACVNILIGLAQKKMHK